MKYLLIIGLLMSVQTLSSCRKEKTETAQNTSTTTKINDYPYQYPDSSELAGLLFMREEEKLARDIYIKMFEKWGINTFNNISESEATHMNAILDILKKYNIPDPVGSNGVGVFKDTVLQEVYGYLLAEGSKSLLDAFKVGATIEDLDIFDLQNNILKVDNQDIIYVYQNLMKGSRNHLRSFYGQILSQGGTYSPQFISVDDFNSIINSPKETGSW